MQTVAELEVSPQLKEVIFELIQYHDWDNYNLFEEGEFSFDYNGLSYDVICISSTQDYTYKKNIYQLASFDDTISLWVVSEEDILDKYNLFFEVIINLQDESQCILSSITQKTISIVPETTISEQTVVQFEPIDY